MAKYSNKFIAALGSKFLTYSLLLFFFLQASWVAVSYRFPMLFDENYHFNVIKYFIDNQSPIITAQDTKYDVLGNLMYGNASLFHQLMSYPLMLIQHLTDNFMFEVIGLRLIGVGLTVLGLYLFVKLFIDNGVPRIFANLTVFVYSMFPLTTLVAATTSYDNLLFPIMAAFLIAGSNIIKMKKFNLKSYIIFICIGLLGCLVKFTFLPVMLAGVIYMSIVEYKRTKNPKNIVATTKKDFRDTNKPIFYGLLLITTVLTLLFSARYLVPVYKYHSPMPDCAKILSYPRCEKSGVYYMGEISKKTKDTRKAYSFYEYGYNWIWQIEGQFSGTANSTIDGRIEVGSRLPIFDLLMFTQFTLGFLALVYMWRSLKKPNNWNFMLFVSAFLVLSIFLFNIASYYSANTDLNVQSRYLLSILPILIMMSIVATSKLIGKRPVAKILLLLVVISLSFQGGGLTKHILESNQTWYWQKPKVINTNNKAREALQPLIIESSKY